MSSRSDSRSAVEAVVSNVVSAVEAREHGGHHVRV